MKKKKRSASVSLRQKIFSIVLIFALAVAGVIIATMASQSYLLKRTIDRVNTVQQKSIGETSTSSLELMVIVGLSERNYLHSQVIEGMFRELENNVKTLQTLAVELFENSESLPPRQVAPPDPATEGTAVIDALWDEGVDYQSSKDLSTAAYMSETMLAMYSTSEKMQTCYIGLADGTFLLLDRTPSEKYDENGNLKNYSADDRPWYKGAVDKGGIWFSDLYQDAFSGKLCVTCSAPVYVNDRLVGVVGIDIFLDSISDYLEEVSMSGTFEFIVNNEGHVIFVPENKYFEVEDAESAKDLRESESTEFADFISEALKGPTEPQIVHLGGDSYYMEATLIEPVGWALISAESTYVFKEPAERLVERYNEINEAATADFIASSRILAILLLLALLAELLIGTVLVNRFTRKIVSPLEIMVTRINDLSDDNLEFKMQDEYRTKDEIERLATSFAVLSKRTVKYIGDIQRITAERERAGTEMRLATEIQTGMLPNTFPPFPDHPEIDIYATMHPAKEVGGDFYDFFLIDDDHLAMVIADVSGKGVPAALFMMSAKILINDHVLMDKTPAEVLDRVNQQICSNNVVGMFVTVWLGILELSTGKLTASSAGHEYPMIRKESGYELMKDPHGMPCGLTGKAEYEDYEIILQKGDSIFTYTDGVTEAADADRKLFGTERTIAALNSLPGDASQQDVLTGVRSSIDAFVKEAPQFDDITMLGVRYFGKES